MTSTMISVPEWAEKAGERKMVPGGKWEYFWHNRETDHGPQQRFIPDGTRVPMWCPPDKTILPLSPTTGGYYEEKA